jgi:hypothetical protein
MIDLPVKDLRLGDMLDLEGDRWADPNRSNTLFEFEYQVVWFIERETPNCTVVFLKDGGAFGFPPDHSVLVADQRDNAFADEMEFVNMLDGTYRD